MRAVIAEDQALLREGLVFVVESAGFEIAGTASDGPSLLAIVHEERPDLVVTDIRMPPAFTDEGLVAALEIRRTMPATAVLVLSAVRAAPVCHGAGSSARRRCRVPPQAADLRHRDVPGGPAPDLLRRHRARPRGRGPPDGTRRLRDASASTGSRRASATCSASWRSGAATRRSRGSWSSRRRRSSTTRPGSTTSSDCRPAPTTTVAFLRSSSTSPRTTEPADPRTRSAQPPAAWIGRRR